MNDLKDSEQDEMLSLMEEIQGENELLQSENYKKQQQISDLSSQNQELMKKIREQSEMISSLNRQGITHRGENGDSTNKGMTHMQKREGHRKTEKNKHSIHSSMKRTRKKGTHKFFRSGLWLQPIIFVAIILLLQKYRPGFLEVSGNWFTCFIAAFLPVLLIFASTSGLPNEEDAMSGKEKAMYPPIPKALLYKYPTGIILGQDRRSGKYVCKALNEDGHVFLIGGSGSGKSSAYVIPALLANPKATIFAVDIKGELSSKSARYDDDRVRIFNPSNRFLYGYDALYKLNDKSTSQQIMEVMQNIAFSLISLPAGLKDPFWKMSARNLLIGLLIHYYKQGTTGFVAIIDHILGCPIQESIHDVMENANPGSVEYRYIVQFDSMEDETLGGIVAEMNNHIVIFSNDQDIRYAFKDNPLKMSPSDLEKGYSIYLSIKEEKLSAYYDVMQLIINQTLAQLETRFEDSEPIIFVIDELPRILSAGKLDRLLDGARTLRSRKVCLYLITQSTEALMTAFSENEVADLISNCPYIIVLSASSTKTQKSVCAWCGKYKVRKTSWNGGGKDRKTTVSYDEKDIVEPSELLVLKNTGEAILITPYGYMRVLKTPYYEDRYLKSLAMANEKHNRKL